MGFRHHIIMNSAAIGFATSVAATEANSDLSLYQYPDDRAVAQLSSHQNLPIENAQNILNNGPSRPLEYDRLAKACHPDYLVADVFQRVSENTPTGITPNIHSRDLREVMAAASYASIIEQAGSYPMVKIFDVNGELVSPWRTSKFGDDYTASNVLRQYGYTPMELDCAQEEKLLFP